MEQSPIPRVSAASADEAGVHVQEQHDVIRLQLISRNGKSEQLAVEVAKFLRRNSPLAALEGAERDGVSIFATAPLEYWVFAEKRLSNEAVAALERSVAESASVFDQSDSRRAFLISGRNVLDVLAKAVPIDLRSQAFPTPGATHSMIAHIPALIARRPESATYEILIPRSYASSFVAWLEEAAMEYGHAVVPDQASCS
jgi:sarcosine oxidase subunit gamma